MTRKQKVASLLQGATRANDNTAGGGTVYNFHAPVTVHVHACGPAVQRVQLDAQNLTSSSAIRRALANVPQLKR